MTKLFEMAVEAARQLSPEEQDELARTILEIVGGETEPYVLTPDDIAAIERGRAAARRGEFATDEQLKAVLSKYSR